MTISSIKISISLFNKKKKINNKPNVIICTSKIIPTPPSYVHMFSIKNITQSQDALRNDKISHAETRSSTMVEVYTEHHRTLQSSSLSPDALSRKRGWNSVFNNLIIDPPEVLYIHFQALLAHT